MTLDVIDPITPIESLDFQQYAQDSLALFFELGTESNQNCLFPTLSCCDKSHNDAVQCHPTPINAEKRAHWLDSMRKHARLEYQITAYWLSSALSPQFVNQSSVMPPPRLTQRYPHQKSPHPHLTSDSSRNPSHCSFY